MRLPEIAQTMKQLAGDPRLPAEISTTLVDLADQMRRRGGGARRTPQSATMTPELADEIRAYHQKNKHLTQTAIARHFNVNSGRVSEALHGKRT
jgi:hypothetical protein